MVLNVGSIKPEILDKFNQDEYADLYADRLFLPEGLNNPQGKVDAMRRQALENARRQEALQQTLPAVTQSAKNVGLKVNQ